MPKTPSAARMNWMSFPDVRSVTNIITSAQDEAKSSTYGPPVPYQFTIKVMSGLYSKLMPNVLADGLTSDADPRDFDAASTAELRAIAYFSWHNERKLFVTRRVFPSYFDFFSLSYVYEGWGALGELLQEIVDEKVSEQKLFTAVKNVFANHRFLPFMKEAHRLNYVAAFVIPFFEGENGQPATRLAKGNLKGAMVFYLAAANALPDTSVPAFQQHVATFSHEFTKLVCLNEKEIQTPVPQTQKDVLAYPWNYWEEARKDSDGLVFAELRIGEIAGDKEKVALDIQSALSSGDFVCLRDTSPACTTDLCFWVTCLVDGKGPKKDSEDVFATKLKLSIAQAVANASSTARYTSTLKLQLEVNIHGRHLGQTPSLDELLLPLRKAREVTKVNVQTFLCDLRSRAGFFMEVAEFSDLRPYGRRLVLQTPAVEVLVMGFHPLRECPPHDHGGSDGLVLVCSGTAEHRIYRREGGNLTLVECTLDPAGSILDAPIDCIHAMGNPGPEPLVTLHIYWPPIKHMTVFDIENRKIYEVNGAAGAWLPIAPETLISCTEL